MPYLFTSESVSEGHPDKIADQISDTILDYFLAFDAHSKVACETLVTTGQVILAGEIKSKVYIYVQELARAVIREIGYTKSDYGFDADSCGILGVLHEQSPDINQGVDKTDIAAQGAGDQGMMFGYATNETETYMPLPLYLAHLILKTLSDIRKEGKRMPYLRPDAKSQVSVLYGDGGQALAVDTVVLSTQHNPFDTDAQMLERIQEDVRNIVMPRVLQRIKEERIRRLFTEKTAYLVNPTGKFVIGGPNGDTGLTGRKIIVDTYGGRAAHGGGAFSGKDPSKVDRSGAYAARHMAKNLVAAGVSDEVLVQIAYAIGVAEPVSLYVHTFGKSKVGLSDGAIAEKLRTIVDLRPYAIEQRLQLRQPIYAETATYGHFGRTPRRVKKVFEQPGLARKEMEVQLFTWELLDYVGQIQRLFDLK